MAAAAAAATESNGGDSESLTHPLLSSQRSVINSTSQVAMVGANVCPIESLDYESVLSSFLLPKFSSFPL